VQFDGSDAVAEIDDGGAGFFFTTPWAFLMDGERGDAVGDGTGL
jgi:hypothetical protein